jgi:hypothetical protein
MIALLRVAQTPPVESWGTYHVAYTLVALIYCAYAFSLWSRARRSRRTIEQAAPPPRG